ncbi:MAG: hypothetical protein ACREXK_07745 [Gammaproteobacteria bacterium]
MVGTAPSAFGTWTPGGSSPRSYAPPEGWAAVTPDGRYKLGGDTAGAFWFAINLCRFEPGELDPYLPECLRRLAPEEPIL